MVLFDSSVKTISTQDIIDIFDTSEDKENTDNVTQVVDDSLSQPLSPIIKSLRRQSSNLDRISLGHLTLTFVNTQALVTALLPIGPEGA